MRCQDSGNGAYHCDNGAYLSSVLLDVSSGIMGINASGTSPRGDLRAQL
jgi:hypothetical protein